MSWGARGQDSRLYPAEIQSPPCSCPLAEPRLRSSSKLLPPPPPPSPRPDDGGLRARIQPCGLWALRATPARPSWCLNEALTKPPRTRSRWAWQGEKNGGHWNAAEALRPSRAREGESTWTPACPPLVRPRSCVDAAPGATLLPRLDETLPCPDDDGQRP